MRIIKEGTVLDFCEQYPDAAESLQSFVTIANSAKWKHPQDVRQTYRHPDAVEVESGKIVTVLNIKGNHYRLVVAIHYNTQVVYILRFLPHSEYTRGNWKKTL